MKGLFEATILFLILFFPKLGAALPPLGEIQFSLLFRIPGIALVFYFINAGSRDGPRKTLFRFGHPLFFLAALSGLLLIGFGLALAARFTGLYPGIPIPAPLGILPWTAVVLSSLTAAYLEESYFRLFLPLRLQEAGLGAVKSYSSAVLLFALCHVYEGPWGFANALLAGALLSFIFARGKSYHAIALAHGLYNIFVYALSAFTK